MADGNALSLMGMDPMQAMQQQMLDRMQKGQERLDPQLTKLQQMAENRADTDSAERWGAMAQAAAQSPALVGGFGTLLANIGGAYGKTVAAQEQRAYENQLALTKLMEQNSMGGSGVATQMAHALLNPIQNIGGVGVARLGGQTIVPKEFEGEYLKLVQKYYQPLVDSGNPNALAEAQRMARLTIYSGLRDPSIAGSTYAQRPETTPMPSQGGAPTEIGMANLSDKSQIKLGMPPELIQAAQADMIKSGDTAGAEAAGALLPKPVPQPLSKPAMKREETLAGEGAKDLVDYEKNTAAESDSAGKQLVNLDKLAEQSKKANLGMSAKFKTDTLRFAELIGIKLDPSDRDAMDANQVIEKIALQLATQGAKAISSRPTQLEFEKLLTSGVPAATMSSGAFQQVLDMFRKQAMTDQNKLAEFMKWKHAMPADQRTVGNFSDYWALRKEPRYAGLSMDDIMETMKARNMTFNQVIAKLRERK